MYNEPYSQLLESLAGVYRAYYELIKIDERYADRVQTCVIIDGYEKVTKEFLSACNKAGIYSEFDNNMFLNVEPNSGNNNIKHEAVPLKFINEKTMQTKTRLYGSETILHTWSRNIKFSELLSGLTKDEKEEFKIDNYSIYDFMLGSDEPGQVKKRIFYHYPMPLHF